VSSVSPSITASTLTRGASSGFSARLRRSLASAAAVGSNAITRPLAPTWAASGSVWAPTLAPMSSTTMPGASSRV
jgi:hypothetical protein